MSQPKQKLDLNVTSAEMQAVIFLLIWIADGIALLTGFPLCVRFPSTVIGAGWRVSMLGFGKVIPGRPEATEPWLPALGFAGLADARDAGGKGGGLGPGIPGGRAIA